MEKTIFEKLEQASRVRYLKTNLHQIMAHRIRVRRSAILLYSAKLFAEWDRMLGRVRAK